MNQTSAPEAVLQTAAKDRRGTASADRISPPAAGADSASRATTVAVASCCVFLLFILAIFLRIRHLNDGHFVYALDDPYIHLALSEQIAHGHYGINPGEYSAPASSILWPFLLAISAGSSLHPYVPLLLNVAAGLVSVYVLARLVVRMSSGAQSPHTWTVRFLTVMLLTFCGNLVSLPFLGLEHELQVMCAILCAAGLCELWSGRPMPVWALVAAAVGPLIRYENLAITVAVAAALVATKQARRAAAVLTAAFVPVAAFSLFLHHLGLKMLPSSVLLKSGQESGSHGAAAQLLQFTSTWFSTFFTHPAHWPIALLAGVLVVLFVRQPVGQKRTVIGAAILVAALQLLVGPFGGFHRYEGYASIFLSIIVLLAAWSSNVVRLPWLLGGLACLASPYLVAAWTTPTASHQIYGQQFQMARFVHDYYRRDFAVNDLGLVSYRRPPGVFVLDLWGLAWYEAGVAQRTPEWLQRSVSAHRVGLAMLYPEWYNVPSSWTPIGQLCLDRRPIFLGGQCVAFYGTTPAATAELEPELRHFATTLPQGTTFIFGSISPPAHGRPPLLRRLLDNLGL